MNAQPLYQVLLLPSREVAARHQTLAEASAWVRTYNHAMRPTPIRPVIAEESSDQEPAAASSQAA